MLTAMLAKKCGLAYGIEVVEEASRCADGLKEENGLQGKMFNICGKVEERLGEAFCGNAGQRAYYSVRPAAQGYGAQRGKSRGGFGRG